MPEMIINQNGSSPTATIPTAQGRWLDQQQYLIETYRQIRINLGELEAEIDAARLRVTDWSQHRRRPMATAGRSRSSSHASGSTSYSCCSSRSGGGGGVSCARKSGQHRSDCCSCRSSCSTTSSCASTTSSSASCCCANRLHLPAAVAASLNAATLISAFLAASALQGDGNSSPSTVDSGSLQTIGCEEACIAELTTESLGGMEERDSNSQPIAHELEAITSSTLRTDQLADSTTCSQ